MGATKEKAMTGMLLIRITEDHASEIRDLRYRYIWSAWLDGTLLGHALECANLRGTHSA